MDDDKKRGRNANPFNNATFQSENRGAPRPMLYNPRNLNSQAQWPNVANNINNINPRVANNIRSLGSHIQIENGENPSVLSNGVTTNNGRGANNTNINPRGENESVLSGENSDLFSPIVSIMADFVFIRMWCAGADLVMADRVIIEHSMELRMDELMFYLQDLNNVLFRFYIGILIMIDQIIQRLLVWKNNGLNIMPDHQPINFRRDYNLLTVLNVRPTVSRNLNKLRNSVRSIAPDVHVGLVPDYNANVVDNNNVEPNNVNVDYADVFNAKVSLKFLNDVRNTLFNLTSTRITANEQLPMNRMYTDSINMMTNYVFNSMILRRPDPPQAGQAGGQAVAKKSKKSNK